MRIKFPNEGIDDALRWVKDVEASNVMEQLAKLIVYLSLILILLVLLLDLSLEDLEELRFQQHLLNRNEDLQDHRKDLTLRKLISDPIGDDDLVVD